MLECVDEEPKFFFMLQSILLGQITKTKDTSTRKQQKWATVHTQNFFWDKVSQYRFDWTGTCYINQAGLKLPEICLPLPSKCWPQRHVLPPLSPATIFFETDLSLTWNFTKQARLAGQQAVCRQLLLDFPAPEIASHSHNLGDRSCTS